MAKWQVSRHATAAALEAAVEALDTTVDIKIVPYLEGNRQVFLLAYQGS